MTHTKNTSLSKFFRIGRIGTICPDPVVSETNSIPTEGGKEDGVYKKGHGRVFCFPEIMCCMFTGLGTNERFSNDKDKSVGLTTFNDTYHSGSSG